MDELRHPPRARPGGKATATRTSRRLFLKSAAAGAALAFPQVATARAVTLTMQTSWGAKDVYHEMARQYVDRVEAMSGRRLRIDLFAADAVVKSFQLQEATHKGVLDGAHLVAAYWYGKNKAASLFGTGPVFGVDASQILAWIHQGGGKELYRELVQDILGLNLVGFFANPFPSQPLGWFRSEITGPGDLEGLKYRTVGLAADMMSRLGLAVVQLPARGVIPAFKRGVIEAFEFANPTSDRALGAHQVSKHYMMGSYHQAAEMFEIIFNKDVYESLSEEHQAILEHAAEAASTANHALAMDRHSKDLDALVSEEGVRVHRTPQSVMNAQLESWDAVLDELMKDPFFRRVVESQKAWARRVGFYELMNAPDHKLAYDHHFPGRVHT